ncbi:hypothetical protein [Roseibium sp. M-1]
MAKALQEIDLTHHQHLCEIAMQIIPNDRVHDIAYASRRLAVRISQRIAEFRWSRFSA